MRSQKGIVLTLFLAACGGDSVDREAAMEEARMAAEEDTVRMASEAYDPAAFAAIEWPDQNAALERGSTVWTFSCTKCHGPTGAGDGGFVLRGDTLRPPSLLRDDWEFAADLDGLRRYIFAGNVDGMPHWGIVGLQPKDIDAVARYIQVFLRAQEAGGL